MDIKNTLFMKQRQIKAGKLDYEEVISKYPQFKDEIDRLLG